ncbi:hypothetical protein D3C71_1806140 [compost metagenome]
MIAIHVRHIDVGQYDVDGVTTEYIQRIDPIIGRHHLVAQRAKLIGQQPTVDRMVVHHQ